MGTIACLITELFKNPVNMNVNSLYCLLLHNYAILDKTVSIFHKCSFLVVAIWICYRIKNTHTPGLWWDCSTQDTPHTGESKGVGSGSAYTCHTCNPQILGDMNTSHWHGTAWTLIPLGHSYRLQFTKYIHILRHFCFVTGLWLTCFPYPHTFFMLQDSKAECSLFPIHENAYKPTTEMLHLLMVGEKCRNRGESICDMHQL